MMVCERTGHSQAEMTGVLVINESGTFTMGALSAEQVSDGSFPPLKSSQEAFYAREIVRKWNVLIPQGVNPGEGKDRVPCDRLTNEV